MASFQMKSFQDYVAIHDYNVKKALRFLISQAIPLDTIFDQESLPQAQEAMREYVTSEYRFVPMAEHIPHKMCGDPLPQGKSMSLGTWYLL